MLKSLLRNGLWVEGFFSSNKAAPNPGDSLLVKLAIGLQIPGQKNLALIRKIARKTFRTFIIVYLIALPPCVVTAIGI